MEIIPVVVAFLGNVGCFLDVEDDGFLVGYAVWYEWVVSVFGRHVEL